MMSSLPPFLIFFLAALIAPFLSPWARKGFLLIVPVLGLANMFSDGRNRWDQHPYVRVVGHKQRDTMPKNR